MSDPKSGPQPPPMPPTRDPREVPEGFRDFPTLAACIVMDNVVNQIRFAAGQLEYLGQRDLSIAFLQALQSLHAMREEFYREALGGIIIARPVDLPRG